MSRAAVAPERRRALALLSNVIAQRLLRPTFLRGAEPHDARRTAQEQDSRPREIKEPARHSYKAEDIVFDKTFVPCMTVAPDGQAHLNWRVFHDVKDCAFNTAQILGGSHS